MLTPLRIGTLCVALTAVLSTTLLVADSGTSNSQGQTISASGDAAQAAVEAAPANDLLAVAGLSPNRRSETNSVAVEEAPGDDVLTGKDPAATGDADVPVVEASTGPVEDSSPLSDSTASDSSTGTSDNPSSPSDTSPAAPSASQSSSNSSDSASMSASEEKPTPATAATTTAIEATEIEVTETASEPPPPPAQSGKYESMRNDNSLFTRYASTPSNQLDTSNLMEPVSPVDYGGNSAGQFRIACEYSHFNSDDPIVHPGQSGKSHFHMYFGNTRTDADTTQDSLVNSGGGSCNGFELNRSSYWTPALLDGKGNAVVPDDIIVYYKTKFPNEVQPMPQGLQIIGGNSNSEDFAASETLFWSCGTSGHSRNHTNRIPSCGDDQINATIAFPQCWDGKNLSSSDFTSHMAQVNETLPCPSSHPVRLPQLTYLLYYPPGNTSGWYLSSDRTDRFNTAPGATLHGDWMGAWHEETMNLWINTCVRRARNCTYGQTGGPLRLAALNPLQKFSGNNVIPIPN